MLILFATTTLVAVCFGHPQGGQYRGMYPYPAGKQSRIDDTSNFKVFSIQEPLPPPIEFPSHNTIDVEPVSYNPPAPAPYSPPAPAPAPYSPPAPVETESPIRYPAPSSYKPPAPAPYENEEPVNGMPYSFSWQVSDEVSGNEYGQEEESNGENTKGSYSVLLPDGRTQKVTYKVDPGAGYTAEIAYEGEAKFPEAPSAAPYKPPEEHQAPEEAPAEAPTEAPARPELFYDPDSDASLNRYTFVDQPRSLFK
ncbi:unnamed protein product [Meganyctiphanes norvegica]|uniref:Cuticle protein n=1 Tax=Meganyctiphanes norvegica TaxID=48144 RepID=A0AAV2PQ55_MEGNR